MFQKLDKIEAAEHLQHVGHGDGSASPPYDPGNQYAIDYMWGTNGIGYNVDKVKQILGTDDKPTLDVIFDPKVAAKFKDCGIYMLDAPKDVHPDSAGLSRPRSELDQAWRISRKPQDLPTSIRPFVPQVPFVRIHQCARQWRYLHRLRLFRRHSAGAQPAPKRPKNGVHVDYFDSRSRAQMWFDVSGDPGRRAACG